uniref:Dynein heavy chain AAA module D4 domain-containing protein n=1 Tax=Magallana gigas TaxID=29159 RepID=A0A8W8IGM2_MAGGI
MRHLKIWRTYQWVQSSPSHLSLTCSRGLHNQDPLIFVLSPEVIRLKRLYWQAGVDYMTTVFIFNETQVMEEGFLEDINNVLSSGEVPNLYKPDEFEEVLYTPLYLN